MFCWMFSGGTHALKCQFLRCWGLKHNQAEMNVCFHRALMCLCAVTGQNQHKMPFPVAFNTRFQQRWCIFVQMLHSKAAVGISDPKTSKHLW